MYRFNQQANRTPWFKNRTASCSGHCSITSENARCARRAGTFPQVRINFSARARINCGRGDVLSNVRKRAVSVLVGAGNLSCIKIQFLEDPSKARSGDRDDCGILYVLLHQSKPKRPHTVYRAFAVHRKANKRPIGRHRRSSRSAERLLPCPAKGAEAKETPVGRKGQNAFRKRVGRTG